MKRYILIVLAVVTVLALGLAACKPSPTPTEAPTQAPTEEATEAPTEEITEAPTEEATEEAGLQGTLVLWHAWKENEIESLNEVIAAFQEQNPGVQVEVLYVPFDDLRNKFETAAATGGGPTVLIGAADWGEPMYRAGLIADLTDMITPELHDSIVEAAWGGVTTSDGKFVGLPQTLKGVVLFRNKQIIPEPAETWDDFVAAAQAATQGDVVGADLEYGFFFSAAHIGACGGKLMEPNGDPAFNNEAGICWVNLLKSFQDVGPTEYYTDNDVNLFKAGKVGYIIDGTWNTSALAEAIGADNLAIDFWPTYGEGHLSGFVQTENIYLSANAEGADKDVAWAFMQFFVSEEAQAILADPTKAAHLPVVPTVEVTDPLMKATLDVFAAQGTPFPVIAEMGAYWGPMDTALKSVFDEGADPAAALQQAYDSIVEAIAEIRGGQ